MEAKAFALTCAVLAVMSFAAFVWLQLSSIENRDFFLLVSSSFFFLGVATILALLIYRGSSDSQKALALAVCIMLIAGTIFMTDSLNQNPRGGGSASTNITMKDFALNIEGRKGSGKVQYRGDYSEVIHKPSYASSYIYLSTSWSEHNLKLTSLTPANVNGTCLVFFILNPYARNAYALLWQEVVFTENHTSQDIDVDVHPSWGGGPQVRFEGYMIDFMLRLYLTGAESGPSALNFTATPYLEIYIGETITSSTFQNNLSIALCGVFIGTNLLVPGSFVFHLLSRRRRQKDSGKQE